MPPSVPLRVGRTHERPWCRDGSGHGGVQLLRLAYRGAPDRSLDERYEPLLIIQSASIPSRVESKPRLIGSMTH